MRLNPSSRILIVKPSSLGDIVHSLPFLNALKSAYPRSEIHWVVARGLEGLIEGHPMVDRPVIIDKESWKKASRAVATAREFAGLFRQLRRERYDVAVDLQGLLRSGMITMATGAAVRVGFRDAREGSNLFYTVRIAGGRNVHAVDRYLKVAAALGCSVDEVIFPFPLRKADLSAVPEVADLPEAYGIIIPGARWKSKIWPAGYFGRLAGMLPFRTVIVGGRSDLAIAEEVAEVSGGRAVSLAGRTGIPELIEVTRGARLVISNDSGPMHIAAGLGVPVVAIFGATSPLRTGPYGEGHLVIRSSRSCSPCFRKDCRSRSCMHEITPEMVCGRIAERFSHLFS